MKTLSPKTSHLILPSKVTSSPDPLLDLTKPIISAEDLKVSQEQKRSLISHLMDWMKILDQQHQSLPKEAEPIVQVGSDNQKQHLLLLSERIKYAVSKTTVIHALQETSEALGKEAARVGFHISHLGLPMDLAKHGVVTTEIRYHILMAILNLCGGTHVLPPQQEAYFPKSALQPK